MGNFQYGDRSRGGRDSSRRSFGGRDRRRVEMHDAVCDECGDNCQVPFRPSGDKPIYCSNCFEKQSGRSGRPSRSSGGGLNPQSVEKLTGSIEALNKKLNSIIEILNSKVEACCGEEVKKVKKAKKKKAKEVVKYQNGRTS